MKKPFQVGDRVAVYQYEQGTTHRWTGEVFSVREESLTIIQGPTSVRVHPKQCRRLVKKERQRVWLNKWNLPWAGSEVRGLISDIDRGSNNWVEFVEVRKKGA